MKATIYVTKQVLTEGIKQYYAEIESDGVASVANHRGVVRTYRGNQWHLTKEAAISKANEIKAKKIAQLQKQIERLNKVEFK